MPTRKQRRRRQKTFRHDYGFVTYDEDGNEVEVEPSQLREPKPEKPKAAAATKGGRGAARTTRVPPVPSWRRSAKRGGLWGGVMMLVVVFLLQGPILIGLLYAAAFIPLTYWIDRLTYRNYQRRAGKT